MYRQNKNIGILLVRYKGGTSKEYRTQISSLYDKLYAVVWGC